MTSDAIIQANARLAKRWPLWNHPELRKGYPIKSSSSSSHRHNRNNNSTSVGSSSNDAAGGGGVEAIFVDPTTIFVCDIEDQSTAGHLVGLLPRERQAANGDNNEKEQHHQQQELPCGNRRHDEQDTIRPSSRTDSKNSSFPSGIYSEPDARKGAASTAAMSVVDHKSNPADGIPQTSMAAAHVLPPKTSTQGTAGSNHAFPTIRKCITFDIAQAWVLMGNAGSEGQEEAAAPPPPPPLKMLPPSSWCSTNAMMAAALPMAASCSYRVRRRRTLRERFGGSGRATTAVSSTSRPANDLLEERNLPRGRRQQLQQQQPPPKKCQQPNHHHHQQQTRQNGHSQQHQQQHAHHRLWQRKPSTVTRSSSAVPLQARSRSPSLDLFSTHGTTSGSLAALVSTSNGAATNNTFPRSSQSFPCDGGRTTTTCSRNNGDEAEETHSLSPSSSTRCCLHRKEDFVRASSLQSPSSSSSTTLLMLGSSSTLAQI
jgi:hypothetical protein